MSDILNFLRAYPDDPTLVMSKARVAEVIAEIERLRAELAAAYDVQRVLLRTDDEVAKAIGPEYLLDPPDGGDVSLAEGVGRIKAERDALRAENKALDKLVQTFLKAMKATDDELDTLRALLREAADRLPEHVRARIDAALKGDGGD